MFFILNGNFSGIEECECKVVGNKCEKSAGDGSLDGMTFASQIVEFKPENNFKVSKI